MWPLTVDWRQLRFGVEFEHETGRDSGSELKPPPMRWQEREQMREMLARLRASGAQANWSCVLHVHVGVEPWGQAIVPPLLDAALTCQRALQALLQTSEHRLIFSPPVTRAMSAAFAVSPSGAVLTYRGRPQSHRCGINAAAWFDIGTVEIRYANASLDGAALASGTHVAGGTVDPLSGPPGPEPGAWR